MSTWIPSKKKGKKTWIASTQLDNHEGEDSSLDGKKLHDLYRHSTKLIK
ncbi:MAG: hypothetical protein ACREA7_04780 [Nitrosotalea sp.]